MPCLGTSICACARTCACAMACEAGVGGGCWGSGLSRCKPRDGLRQAKGAPDGDGTAGRRVSWKPNANAERLAGRAEATQLPSPAFPRGLCGLARVGGPRRRRSAATLCFVGLGAGEDGGWSSPSPAGCVAAPEAAFPQVFPRWVWELSGAPLCPSFSGDPRPPVLRKKLLFFHSSLGLGRERSLEALGLSSHVPPFILRSSGVRSRGDRDSTVRLAPSPAPGLQAKLDWCLLSTCFLKRKT